MSVNQIQKLTSETFSSLVNLESRESFFFTITLALLIGQWTKVVGESPSNLKYPWLYLNNSN